MKNEDKKQAIKSMTKGFLSHASESMSEKIDRAINSGAIDIENWDENINPAILPKIILIALLENEASSWSGKGTCFEKEMKKEIKNLKYFL